MSKYTTGEIAKLCGVSVRTVQYYDSRNILIPSELTEGGRRLYSEEDLKRMRIICFLRDAGLSINSIGELFMEEDASSVISLILEGQESILREELNERQTQLTMIEQIKRELKNIDNFSVDSIGDIAHVMKSRKMMFRVRATVLCLAVIAEIIEVGLLLLWIFKGIWQPYAIGMLFVIGICAWTVKFYFKKADYICPKCHTVFKPRFAEMFWARHTPTTRKLTCTKCGHHGFCVETYSETKTNT